MAKGYWVVNTEITDEEQHSKYSQGNRAVLSRYGAKFLVRWGRYEVPEGTSRSRHIVIEFPDYAAALDCYNDPEYKTAHKFREGVTFGDMVIVEGYDGTQPDVEAAAQRAAASA